jgi:hypothetical protein
VPKAALKGVLGIVLDWMLDLYLTHTLKSVPNWVLNGCIY